MMTNRGVYVAVAYMVSSVLLTMFNKAALSSYEFQSANVIALLQMIFSCSILYAMRYWKFISFTTGEPNNTNNPVTIIPMKTLVRTIPLALSYLVYMPITMESIRSINVPMYTALRRPTIAFTVAIEYIITGQRHSPSVIASVGVIIIGTVAAGARDLSFDASAYTVVFIANICTAIYLASITRVGESSGLNPFGLMWCNGLLCTPILLMWTFLRGELRAALNFPYIYSPGFQAVMLLSCITAFLINYFVVLNTTVNSALTQTVCSNVKDLFTICLGWLLFGGLPLDPMNVLGQFLGFLGSVLYAYFKFRGN